MTTPKVTAIVLNWNNFEDTSKCLDSLLDQKYESLEVIVVDNGSVDDSHSKIRQQYPSIRVIRNEENLGFPGGMNPGIKFGLNSGSKYILLLNNDVIIEHEDFCSEMVKRMEEQDSIGILTPQIRSFSDNEVWFRQGHLNRKTGFTTHDNEMGDSDQKLLQNDYIPNTCAMIREGVFNDVGLLPEYYFLYYEDVEFSLKAKEKGYQLVTDTSLEVLHKGTASSEGEFGATISYYKARNRIVFKQQRNEGLTVYFLFSYFWWLLTRVGFRIVTFRLLSAFSMVRGAYDGYRNQTGRGPYP